MSFSITQPPLPRAEAARAMREGDHHARGLHTHLDQAREFIAETIEHTGEETDLVAVSVTGWHTQVERSLTLHTTVHHRAEAFDKPETDAPKPREVVI